MVGFLKILNNWVWGIPALGMIFGVGLFLSLKTKFVQIRLLPYAICNFIKQFRNRKSSSEGVSGYRALCIALGATVGTGNLAGVAGAIAIGGPGSIFWMWILALFGMVTKFAEAALSVRYRQKAENGEYVSGPMFMIRDGLPNCFHWLSVVYCFLGIVASFGVGNATQVNTVIGSMESAASSFGIEINSSVRFIIGIVISVLVVALLSGGAKRIGRTTEILVPYAAIGYLIIGSVVLVINAQAIPAALFAIFKGAFSPDAVTGGAVGSMISAVRIGASRGIFTNEAGMGTASIAHGSAAVDHPVKQGSMGIIEVFIDTIVICTMTGLVILCSGVTIPYGVDTGIGLTTEAFSAVFGRWINIPLALAVCVFAFATILGWSFYGIRCGQYLFGEKVYGIFVVLQGVAAILGVCLKTGTVWVISEIVNGLMAMPNLFALTYLAPELVRITDSFGMLKRDRPE